MGALGPGARGGVYNLGSGGRLAIRAELIAFALHKSHVRTDVLNLAFACVYEVTAETTYYVLASHYSKRVRSKTKSHRHVNVWDRSSPWVTEQFDDVREALVQYDKLVAERSGASMKLELLHNDVRLDGLDWMGAWFLLESDNMTLRDWVEAVGAPYSTLSVKTKVDEDDDEDDEPRVMLPSDYASDTDELEPDEEVIGNEDGLLPDSIDWRGDLGLD